MSCRGSQHLHPQHDVRALSGLGCMATGLSELSVLGGRCEIFIAY